MESDYQGRDGARYNYRARWVQKKIAKTIDNGIADWLSGFERGGRVDDVLMVPDGDRHFLVLARIMELVPAEDRRGKE